MAEPSEKPEDAAKMLIERFLDRPELLDELRERLESDDLVD